MTVFRVEQNKGHIVRSNHHLRNKKLTLEAKSLLSPMLSLQEKWEYILAGLFFINREKNQPFKKAAHEWRKKAL